MTSSKATGYLSFYTYQTMIKLSGMAHQVWLKHPHKSNWRDVKSHVNYSKMLPWMLYNANTFPKDRWLRRRLLKFMNTKTYFVASVDKDDVSISKTQGTSPQIIQFQLPHQMKRDSLLSLNAFSQDSVEESSRAVSAHGVWEWANGHQRNCCHGEGCVNEQAFIQFILA